MLLNRRSPFLRLARLFAFAALLCVTALQAEEAGHWHESGDGIAHCLLCKSSAGVALAPTETTLTVSLAGVPVAAATVQSVITSVIHTPRARGPPHFS